MAKLQVSIVMGSTSDLETMKEAGNLLKKFGVFFEVRVLSAHRTPAETAAYASQLKERGVEVVIAGAGGSAALAGTLAAHTDLPVIGVPIESNLLGVDSLLSTVQMPSGVPVAGMGIGKAGAKNAAFFALRILALEDKDIAKKLRDYRLVQVEKIKNTKVEI